MPASSTARRREAPAREKLLIAAEELFYARGVHAVGIDEVIAKAGVAKMSLYHHFASKDELIVEFLRRRHERWMETFRARVAAVRTTARLRPLAVFDALNAWFAEESFRGCAFVNTAAEISDPNHIARNVCREHKESLEGAVRELLVDAGVRQAATVAREFMILIEGAIVRALMTGRAEVAIEARKVAEVLLRAALPH